MQPYGLIIFLSLLVISKLDASHRKGETGEKFSNQKAQDLYLNVLTYESTIIVLFFLSDSWKSVPREVKIKFNKKRYMMKTAN